MDFQEIKNKATPFSFIFNPIKNLFLLDLFWKICKPIQNVLNEKNMFSFDFNKLNYQAFAIFDVSSFDTVLLAFIGTSNRNGIRYALYQNSKIFYMWNELNNLTRLLKKQAGHCHWQSMLYLELYQELGNYLCKNNDNKSITS